MAKSVKSSQPLRATTKQSATATAAGVNPAEVQELIKDDGFRIVVVPLLKSKGGNEAGYQVQLQAPGSTVMPDGTERPNIVETDPKVYTEATKAATSGRAQWSYAEVDEDKALGFFFDAFVERFNSFVGLTKSDKLGTIAVMERLVALYIVKVEADKDSE